MLLEAVDGCLDIHIIYIYKLLRRYMEKKNTNSESRNEYYNIYIGGKEIVRRTKT